MLDVVIQLCVVNRTTTAPPSAPENGMLFIIGANATDEWLGKDGEIAAFQDKAWAYYTPQKGWQSWIVDAATFAV